MAAPLSTSEKLRRAADELYRAADDYEIPSNSTVRAEMLVHRVEEACLDGRRAVRGPGLR